jgi:hypothetical protein
LLPGAGTHSEGLPRYYCGQDVRLMEPINTTSTQWTADSVTQTASTHQLGPPEVIIGEWSGAPYQ